MFFFNRRFINSFVLLFCMCFIFYSCASLRLANIEIPEDIDKQAEVKEASKDKQEQSKELKIIHHTIEETKPVTDKTINKTQSKATNKKTANIIQTGKIISTEKTINNPFKVGEKIRLDLYYIGIRAASLVMETMPFVELNNKKAFHFRGIAQTTSLMKYIYRVHDVIDSYVDFSNFVPLKMTLKMDESKQNVSMVLIYDHKKGKSTFWKKRIDAKKKVEEIKRLDDFVPYAQDIFSALYFVRTHDFKLGDKIRFVVHDNGKNWNMTIEAVKKEKIWTRLGNVETIVLVPTVEREGEIFTKGKMSLWVTSDERKIPVKFEAEVKIGTLKGIIKDYIQE
jgi:hypothetical protein